MNTAMLRLVNSVYACRLELCNYLTAFRDLLQYSFDNLRLFHRPRMLVIEHENCKIIFFTNGGVRIMGKYLDESKAAKLLNDILSNLDLDLEFELHLQTHTWVYQFNKTNLDMTTLRKNLNWSYEPELFPAIHTRTDKFHVNLFSTGKATFLGRGSESELNSLIKHIQKYI